jgi:hypothetical protein|tara:strand:+ start:415 stop:588 length:174 start_codon:yes stop_codon:yes gene_type:complete
MPAIRTTFCSPLIECQGFLGYKMRDLIFVNRIYKTGYSITVIPFHIFTTDGKSMIGT